jgi:ribonuclease G
LSDRKIIADTLEGEETRVAVVEDGRLAEVFFERTGDRQKTGDIYKAKVDRVLPGIRAAFLSLGDGRNGFLYLNDAEGINVTENMEIVVQIVREARKNKGARVTPRVSLPGRYLVLIPGGDEAGVSRRIENERERKRLRKLAEAFKQRFAEAGGFGLIVRTAADGIDEEFLERDLRTLLSLHGDIAAAAREKKPTPYLLYSEMGLLGRVLRDQDSVDEIIISGEEEWRRAASFFKGTGPSVALYDGVAPIFEFYGIEREIAAALERKVWLRSGAYLVIEPTEALTVIDVNTGKYVGDEVTPEVRRTILETNLEAADEIAHQLRLRSVGGIVVIDFIDMDFEEDRRRLLDRLEEVFQPDRQKVKVHGITKLGLVELTRKRGRPDLRSVMTRGCPLCAETGRAPGDEASAMSAKRFLRKVLRANGAPALLLETDVDTARYVGETYLEAWRQELGRVLVVAGIPDFTPGKHRVGAQGALPHVAEHAEKLMAAFGRETVYGA